MNKVVKYCKLCYWFLQDPERKPLIRVFSDLKHVYDKEKEIVYYFSNLLYKRTCEDIDNYVSIKTLQNITDKCYRPDGKQHELLQEKDKFQDFLIQNNIPSPKQVGKICSKSFHPISGLPTDVSTFESFEKLVESLVQQNKSLFIKIVDGEGGDGVYKLNDNENNADVLAEIYAQVIEEQSFTVEQTIQQHEYLNRINPYSINTLRVVTYRDELGEITIASCFLRMGVGESYVDNGSSGGIYVDYDIHKNKLAKEAYNFFKNGGRTFIEHPTSKFRFEGKSLPESAEVIAMVTKLAKSFDNKIIGWDIAYTPSGPIVIEGNDNPHLTMMQVASRGFRRHEVYRKVFAPYFLS